MRCGVFVNYRRADTARVAAAVTDALRRRLPSAEVFLDDRSIALGAAFSQVLADGVRNSAVLLALIGPQWDDPPLRERLAEPDDWVRWEIRTAHEEGRTVIPVLVDRAELPRREHLPEDLHFLPTLQAARIRSDDDGADEIASGVAALLPMECGGAAPPGEDGVPTTRTAVDALLHGTLPRSQQASGNRERLVELVLTVLTSGDRLIHLAPARLTGRPNGSATVMLTPNDIVVADVDETFHVRGEIRFPRARIRRVELVRTRRMIVGRTADVDLHTTAGDVVRLEGLFRDQAQQLADHLRA